ncbi:MAG: hypothetical protein AAGF66_06395 [Cyanobacteria bacterium P01_H01_bin.119]
MKGTSESGSSHIAEDVHIWQSLKQAISNSSGFQRWQGEQPEHLQQLSYDQLVRRYLRETLETLAY